MKFDDNDDSHLNVDNADQDSRISGDDLLSTGGQQQSNETLIQINDAECMPSNKRSTHNLSLSQSFESSLKKSAFDQVNTDGLGSLSNNTLDRLLVRKITITYTVQLWTQ